MKKNFISKIAIRIYSVRKEIRYAFFTAFISVLLIEFVLKNFPAPFSFFYTFGEFYLRICYSIVAASIFFYINQHLPKEEKKFKSFIFLNNRTKQICGEVMMLLSRVGVKVETSEFKGITQEMVENACIMVDTRKPVISIGEGNFKNMFEYLDYKSSHIKELISDLILLNEITDIDLLEKLFYLEFKISFFYHINRKMVGNTNLDTWKTVFFEMAVTCNAIYNIHQRIAGKHYKLSKVMKKNIR